MIAFVYVLRQLSLTPPAPDAPTFPAWLIPVLSFLGVVIGAGVTWLIAKRKSSGNVETSDAADLWRESQDMRSFLHAEVVELRARRSELEQKIIQLEASRDTLVSDLHQARQELEQCNRQIDALRAEVSGYKQASLDLHAEVRKLRRSTNQTTADINIIRQEMSVADSLARSSVRRTKKAKAKT